VRTCASGAQPNWDHNQPVCTAYCEVSINPGSIYLLDSWTRGNVEAVVTNVQNGTVSKVQFSVSPDAGSPVGFASVNPSSDNSSLYQTGVTANVGDAAGQPQPEGCFARALPGAAGEIKPKYPEHKFTQNFARDVRVRQSAAQSAGRRGY